MCVYSFGFTFDLEPIVNFSQSGFLHKLLLAGFGALQEAHLITSLALGIAAVLVSSISHVPPHEPSAGDASSSTFIFSLFASGVGVIRGAFRLFGIMRGLFIMFSVGGGDNVDLESEPTGPGVAEHGGATTERFDDSSDFACM